MSSIAPQDTTNLLKFEVMQITAPYCTCIQTYFENNYRPEFERSVIIFRVRLNSKYPCFAHVSALTYRMIYDS